MRIPTPTRAAGPGWSRRDFLKIGAAGAGALAFAPKAASGAPAVLRSPKPNILFIMCDQMNLDALSAHGNTFANTPNLDRLVSLGTTFMESHSPNPVCSPARSSMITGRMPVETGVVTNDLAVAPGIPNMGQWFGQHGYDSVYCGKWHLPEGWAISPPGFTVLPVGAGQGDLVDTIIGRSCEAFLHSRTPSDNPFLLVASFMQPHDICYWAIMNDVLVPADLPFDESFTGPWPSLPPNHLAEPEAPQRLANQRYRAFNADQWRFYLHSYYRQVEMLDHDVGRVLDALEDSGLAGNTVIVFTSDHGEGAGRHRHVQKWYPYDEAMKVPLVIAQPGTLAEGAVDATHLASGLDLMATMCDCAGIPKPPGTTFSRSLKPLCQGQSPEWRDYLVCEWQQQGRIVRTNRWKYVSFEGDPVEQLFDMQADPWETTNLWNEAQHASVMADHRAMLAEWESWMVPAR